MNTGNVELVIRHYAKRNILASKNNFEEEKAQIWAIAWKQYEITVTIHLEQQERTEDRVIVLW